MSDSTNSAAPAASTAATPVPAAQAAAPAQPAPEKDLRTPEEKVADLLAGKNPEKEPDAAPGREAKADDESPEKGEQQAADDAPETDEESEDVKAFYAKEVKLSNGESMTVGQLKDLAQDHAAAVLELTERENRVMTRYNELQEFGQYLQLPPEALQRVQRLQSQHLYEQHVAMLEAIPEFKDQAAFEKGRAAIFELGKEYGVDLGQVGDHRVVKMLHDFARLRAQIKTARANLKTVRAPEPKAKPAPINGQGGELAQRIATAKQTGKESDQLAAIDLLLAPR